MALLPCRSCCSARHGSDLWQGPVTPQDRHAARDRSTALESPNWDGETQPYLPVNKNISLLLPSITQHKPTWSRFSPEHSSITQHGSAEPNTAQFQPSLFPACTAKHGPVQPISRAVQPISSPFPAQPQGWDAQSWITTQLPLLPSSRSFPAPVPPQGPLGDPVLCQTPGCSPRKQPSRSQLCQGPRLEDPRRAGEADEWGQQELESN